jgi:hypothetical protein
MHPLPPTATSSRPPAGLETLDWEGQVRCDGDVANGSFNAGKVVVKVGCLLVGGAPRVSTFFSVFFFFLLAFEGLYCAGAEPAAPAIVAAAGTAARASDSAHDGFVGGHDARQYEALRRGWEHGVSCLCISAGTFFQGRIQWGGICDHETFCQLFVRWTRIRSMPKLNPLPS